MRTYVAILSVPDAAERYQWDVFAFEGDVSQVQTVVETQPEVHSERNRTGRPRKRDQHLLLRKATDPMRSHWSLLLDYH
jgi:hypothetical protein